MPCQNQVLSDNYLKLTAYLFYPPPPPHIFFCMCAFIKEWFFKPSKNDKHLTIHAIIVLKLITRDIWDGDTCMPLPPPSMQDYK